MTTAKTTPRKINGSSVASTIHSKKGVSASIVWEKTSAGIRSRDGSVAPKSAATHTEIRTRAHI